MSKNFDGLMSPFDENIENGKLKTPAKKSDSELKSDFEETSDVKSPFIDEIANPKSRGY